MNGKITLDRDTFKVLSSDTRIEILKRISEHKLTLSDLAKDMGMSPSTIKEHLDRLVEAGLIEHLERDTKWKYYVLTGKGKSIVSPVESRVWILLSSSLALLSAIFLDAYGRLRSAGVTPVSAAARQLYKVPESGAAAFDSDGGLEASEKAFTAAREVGVEAASEAELMPEKTMRLMKTVNESVRGADDSLQNATRNIPDTADVLIENASRMAKEASGKAVEALGDKPGQMFAQASAGTEAGFLQTIPAWEIILMIITALVLAYTLIYVSRQRVDFKL